MTRRRVLLPLAVTVLALACAAPWWERVWLWLAYESHPYRSPDFSDSYGFEVEVYSLKWAQPSLPEVHVPDHECEDCYAARNIQRWSAEMRKQHGGGLISNVGGSGYIELDGQGTGSHCIGVAGLMEDLQIPFKLICSDGFIYTGPRTWDCLCPTCYPERQ